MASWKRRSLATSIHEKLLSSDVDVVSMSPGFTCWKFGVLSEGIKLVPVRSLVHITPVVINA